MTKEVTEGDMSKVEAALKAKSDEPLHICYARVKDEVIVAVGKSRVYLLKLPDKKGVAKVLKDSHLLELTEINSDEPSSVDVVFKGAKFELKETAADELITAIRSAFDRTFFNSKSRVKLQVKPESRVRALEPPGQAVLDKSCGAFSATYSSLCNYYSTPVRVDVCWDMDNLLPANNVREFNLNEIESLTSADMSALMKTLHLNTYFTILNAEHYPLDKNAFQDIAEMLATNRRIEELRMTNCGGTAAHVSLLAEGMAKNKNTAINGIDWSNSAVEDKGFSALGSAVGAMGHGLRYLLLSDAQAKSKGTAALLNGLKKNAFNAQSLTRLTLSGNRLDADGSRELAAFLSAPNMLQHLDISNTGAALENIFHAMLLGCTQELVSLNVARNDLAQLGAKKDGLLKFLQGAGSLKELNLAGCKIPISILREVLKAVAGNVYLQGVEINLADNHYGSLGANMLQQTCAELGTIAALDLSNNDFGDDGLALLATGFQNFPKLRKLSLRDNYRKSDKSCAKSIDELTNLVTSSTVALESLDLSSTQKDTRCARDDLLAFINALATNDSLKVLNVSGHALGDKGGIALGKALQTNRTLRQLEWDGNLTGFLGFRGFAYGLSKNSALTTMPVPLADVSAAIAAEKSAERAKELQTMMVGVQDTLSRNQNPKAAFSKQGEGRAINIWAMGDREEIDNLKGRVKAALSGKRATEAQERLLSDADHNDGSLNEIERVGAELAAALNDEIRSKLAASIDALRPLMENVQKVAVERVCAIVRERYASLDATWAAQLGATLRGGVKLTACKEKIMDFMMSSAAPAVTAAISDAVTVATIDLAIEEVNAQLFDDLTAVHDALREKQRKQKDDDDDAAASADGGGDASASGGGGEGSSDRTSEDSSAPPKMSKAMSKDALKIGKGKDRSDSVKASGSKKAEKPPKEDKKKDKKAPGSKLKEDGSSSPRTERADTASSLGTESTEAAAPAPEKPAEKPAEKPNPNPNPSGGPPVPGKLKPNAVDIPMGGLMGGGAPPRRPPPIASAGVGAQAASGPLEPTGKKPPPPVPAKPGGLAAAKGGSVPRPGGVNNNINNNNNNSNNHKEAVAKAPPPAVVSKVMEEKEKENEEEEGDAEGTTLSHATRDRPIRKGRRPPTRRPMLREAANPT